MPLPNRKHQNKIRTKDTDHCEIKLIPQSGPSGGIGGGNIDAYGSPNAKEDGKSAAQNNVESPPTVHLRHPSMGRIVSELGCVHESEEQ